MFYRLQKAEKKAFFSSHPLCNDAPLFELSVGNNNNHFEWRKGEGVWIVLFTEVTTI